MKMKNLSYQLIISSIFFLGCQKKTTFLEQIHVTTNENITHVKSEIKIEIKANDKKEDATIKTRGGYSINFPKKSYEIDLDNELELLGLPIDDDWILNANFIDKTFLRHVISYEIFQKMNHHNISPKTKHFELFINENYQGLYILMEKMDKSTLKVKSQDSASFIFKDPHIFRKNYTNIIPQKKNNFHQQTFPKITDSNKNNIIDEIRDFIINSNDSLFEEKITQTFDIDNIIDWHLLLWLTNNSDGILKNFYLYKVDKNTPVRISPWDYDHSFGRDGDNELNMNERKININRSILFSRLMKYDWYKRNLKERWIELNDKNILSAKGVKMLIINRYEKLEEYINRNNEKWPVNHSIYYDHNNSNQEINIMLNFIDKRHSEINNYFYKNK